MNIPTAIISNRARIVAAEGGNNAVGSAVKNGSTSANRAGQNLHKAYKSLEHNPAKGVFKEYTGY